MTSADTRFLHLDTNLQSNNRLGATLVFVEVKSRQSDEYGAPDRAIDGEKRRRLARAARDYTRRAGVAWECIRFDVVNVIHSEPPTITHLRDAFRPPLPHG